MDEQYLSKMPHTEEVSGKPSCGGWIDCDPNENPSQATVGLERERAMFSNPARTLNRPLCRVVGQLVNRFNH
ncbi:hypothetical protein CRG98_050400 [Punica granatum]|uniref:Uncharacterized protein n=1 Tax=Punica granatum TaxID=22663 RepID=A0A2I0GCD2_PUNGR|nr:hypothetical protein CRG98_050400 [Punica granatum]